MYHDLLVRHFCKGSVRFWMYLRVSYAPIGALINQKQSQNNIVKYYYNLK